MGAHITKCGQYRYWLTRVLSSFFLQPTRRTLAICMLNPSTADATFDDRTILKCKRFAIAWGYTDIVVVNLYAYRATDPSHLWWQPDPIGVYNNLCIQQVAADNGTVLVAWGANAPLERQWEVAKLITEAGAKMVCLGLTKNGSPKHPLYIKETTKPMTYEVVQTPTSVHVITGFDLE